MANIDKISVKNTVFNIISPAVVSDYIEVIGGACTKPDGYEEDEVILAKQNDVQLLFKATQDIAFGANIVENTNCVRTTLEEVLKNAGGGGGASSADQVSYDNSESGLEAENVQEAVDELATKARTASSQIQTLTNEANAMVNVYGAKNLLANKMQSDSVVSHGITFARQSDGSVHVTGSTDGTYATIYYHNNFNNSFPVDVIASGGVENGIHVDVFWKDSGGTMHVYVVGASEVTIPANTFITSIALTVTDPHSNVDAILKPMFRDAHIVDSTYQPYTMTNQELTPIAQAVSNRNLLDNPWFTVNQRGFVSTNTAGYTVDRWQLSWNPGNITVSLGNDGITLDATNATGLGYFAQFIDNLDIAGKVVTASVLLADGTIKTGTGVMPTKGSTGPYIITGEFNLYLQYNSNNDTPRLYISIEEGHSVTIKAVKLELGSVSTLAQDTAPNYAEELLKCQRYFQRFKPSSGYAWIGIGIGEGSTTLQFLIDLPVVMRANPTISYSDVGVWSSNESGMLSSIASDGITGNKIHATVTSGASFTSGRVVCLWLNSTLNAYMDFSADL